MSTNTTNKPLVKDPANIRLAMLGMIQGNGHPFSWSAIINGRYDTQAMADCGYPVIPQYLGAAPKDQLGLAGAQVTHVWCDDPADTPRVAKAAFIPNVVKQPEDVIGQVDAVLIATDDGSDHVRRARPFIDAGVPVFVDKPLVDNVKDLSQFIDWHKQGKPFLTSSAMRFAPEFNALPNQLEKLGELRVAHVTMCKTWDRYGIHALESIYHPLAAILPQGQWHSVTHNGNKAGNHEPGNTNTNIVVLTHTSGATIILSVVYDMVGAFAHVNLYGTKGHLHAQAKDTFTAFRSQLVSYIDYLRTGQSAIPFDQTIEQMKIIIAGLRSREQQGTTVLLKDILP